MNIDRGQFVGRGLKDVAIVMDLHELAPGGGRATSGRDGRWLEWFAEVCENLTSRGRSHLGLLPLANLRFDVGRLLPAVCSEPNVTAAVRALKRKLLPHPRHEFRPRNPRRVVRAWVLRRVIRGAAAFRGVTVAPMPAGRGLARLADVADRQRRDGFSQPVVRREYSVIPMPVLPRRRHEVRQPVQELKRHEFDDAIGSRPRGLSAAAGPDPVGGFVSGQHVADAGCAAVWAASHGESLERKGRPGAVSEKMLEGLTIDTQLETKECDPDARIDGKPAVLPGEHVGGGRGVEEALHAEPPDQAAADPLGGCGQIGLGDRSRR